MSYIQYFLKNSKWLALFLVLLIGFVIYTAYADGEEYRSESFFVAGFFGVVLIIAIVGDYINWKQLRK